MNAHTITICILAPLCAMTAAADTAAAPDWDLRSDTWVAADALGRHLPARPECGPLRSDRFVGIFYWTWHTHNAARGPYDVTKILAENPDNPQWGPVAAPHHWGEPELDYYISTDPWVIRKHASMLADAGIDVIIFDTTNPPFTFRESYMALCAEYRAIRSQGNRTPQIAFLTPFGDPSGVVQTLYDEFYSKGDYKELWFHWDNRPLIMADPAKIKDPAIKSFFTYRKPVPSYFTGPAAPNEWGWLEVYPQHAFRTADGRVEQVTVGIAQNAVKGELAAMSHKDGAHGRSWHNGAKDTSPNAVHVGYNFAEQWRRALELDPQFVFITGWNEWVAGRFTQWYKYTGKDSYYPDALFVDQYDHEYSRDIEPMKAGHTDTYYYQMISCIRRYKGLSDPPKPFAPGPISIDGDFSDWTAVIPEYRDTIGDTAHRAHRGYGQTFYRNTTGRNDIVLCKVAHDPQYISFYVETADPLTPHTDPNWMLLFIDADQNTQTGWHGYDYLVNFSVIDAAKTTVKHTKSGWNWTPVAVVPYSKKDRRLELKIPLKTLNLKSPPAIDFHWADNIQKNDDIIQFAISGDSAPNRRFNYRYNP